MSKEINLSTEQKPSSRFIIKLLAISLVLGIALTLSSIIVGKKSPYWQCHFTGNNLQIVDRGFPLSYFRVTPSPSDCDPVEEVSAVIKTDVGNEIKPEVFAVNVLFWSAISLIILIAARSLRH